MQQDVEGAARRTEVHHFVTAPRALQALAHCARRKALARACAEQQDLGLQGKQAIKVLRDEVGIALRTPVRDQLLGRDDTAARDELRTDADALRAVGADHVASAAFEREFHLRTIASVQELVIVLPDLLLPWPDTPSLAWAARFGERQPLPEGWRAWLATWAAGHASRAPAAGAPPAAPQAPGRSFLARPMHLIAGLTDVHAQLRSILELEDAELERLAADFRRDFAGGTLALHAVSGGELLLEGVDCGATETSEPALAVMHGIRAALPRGPGAPALRRLQSELEMWLHAHPLNSDRQRRGLPPVTALWLWSVGPEMPAAAAGPREGSAGEGSPGRGNPGVDAPGAMLVFSRDAWLRALAQRVGAGVRDPPSQCSTVLGYPAARAVLTAALVPLLQQDPALSPTDALAHIDRACLDPALRALRQGRLQRLQILAPSWRIELRPRAHLRFWRRLRRIPAETMR